MREPGNRRFTDAGTCHVNGPSRLDVGVEHGAFSGRVPERNPHANLFSTSRSFSGT